MKNKKIWVISFMLLVMYTMSLFPATVGAEMPITISVTHCEIEGKTLDIEGTTMSGGDPVSADVSIVAYKQGGAYMGADTKYVGKIKSDDEGNFSKEITIYDLETEKQFYMLDVAFDNQYAEERIVKTVQYTNDKQIDYSISRLKGSSDVYAYIIAEDSPLTAEQNITLFENIGVWVDVYTALNKGKDVAATIAGASSSKINKGNIAAVLDGSLIATQLTDSDVTISEKIEMLEKYDENIYEISVEGKSFSEQTDVNKKWIAENVVANNKAGFISYEEFIDAVRKSMLLCLIDTTDYVHMRDMFLNNADILDDGLSTLKALDESDSDKVLKQIKLNNGKNKYRTVAKLVEDIKKEIKALPKGSDNKTPGSSNSGGRASTGYIEPSKRDEKPIEDNKQIFTDLADYNWAEEAIMMLYSKGIVSGVSADAFEPGRSITREEFVKLVCVAFGFGESSDYISFKDIPDDAWYKKYVARGVELGIITGIDENTFGSGRNITREDMSVIIVRSLKAKNIEVSDDEKIFADDNEIADYAKGAVKALAGLGIVNGTGDDNFSPKANATRAETAVIINRCLNKFNL